MIRILFVCTGNICRSPTAEGVFRHLATAAGLENWFYIDSAGTDAHHKGESPDPRAIKVANSNGISLDGIRSRPLRAEDFAAFDYIYAMDSGHLFEISERAPQDRTMRIEMFLSALDDEDRLDVPDPWYGDITDFQHSFALINEGAQALLKRLQTENGL